MLLRGRSCAIFYREAVKRGSGKFYSAIVSRETDGSAVDPVIVHVNQSDPNNEQRNIISLYKTPGRLHQGCLPHPPGRAAAPRHAPQAVDVPPRVPRPPPIPLCCTEAKPPFPATIGAAAPGRSGRRYPNRNNPAQSESGRSSIPRA